MHLRILLIFSVISIWILSVGYNNGPAQIEGIDRTGSPLSGGAFCGECHNSGGSYNPEMLISVVDKNDQSVTKYTPGETYKLRVGYEFEGTPAGYGVQAVVLDLDQNNAGIFKNGSQKTQIVEINDVAFFEHEKLVSILPFEVEWIAPPAGTGQVIAYAGGIVANGNRGNSGDNAVLGKVDLTEDTGTSTDDFDENQINFQLLNNPTNQKIRVTLESEHQGIYQFKLYDLAGKILLKKSEFVSESQIIEMNIEHLNGGIYFLQISDNQQSTTKKVLKI